jgi:hypothetical protein
VGGRELLEAHRYRHRVVNENVDVALAEIERVLMAAGFPAAGFPAGGLPPAGTPAAVTTSPSDPHEAHQEAES